MPWSLQFPQLSSASPGPAAREVYTGCTCPMSLKVLQSELNVSQTLLYGFKIITSDSCYSLVDEEAKVLLQNSWSSRRRIKKETLEPTPANKQSLVAGMVLEAWHWTLLLDSFQEFPKNFNGGCTCTLWSWLALKAAHPLASRWLRKAMSCQISKGQPQTS